MGSVVCTAGQPLHCKHFPQPPPATSMFSTSLISRSLSTGVKEVVVMGGGLMGTGIAQVAAQTQHSVTLVDLDQNILDKAQARIETSLGRVAKKGFKDDPRAGEEFVEKCLKNVS